MRAPTDRYEDVDPVPIVASHGPDPHPCCMSDKPIDHRTRPKFTLPNGRDSQASGLTSPLSISLPRSPRSPCRGQTVGIAPRPPACNNSNNQIPWHAEYEAFLPATTYGTAANTREAISGPGLDRDTLIKLPLHHWPTRGQHAYSTGRPHQAISRTNR